MTIPGLKNSFLFISFANFYLIIDIYQIQLYESLGLAKEIKRFSNER